MWLTRKRHGEHREPVVAELGPVVAGAQAEPRQQRAAHVRCQRGHAQPRRRPAYTHLLHKVTQGVEHEYKETLFR